MSIVLTRASGQYLTVPYNAVLAATTITLMGWVKPSSATMQRVMSRYSTQTTANEIWAIDVYQSNARLILGKGTTSVTVDTVVGGSVAAGVWTHIAGTYNGSAMLVYVNGIQVGTFSRTAAIATATSAMSIGADYQGAALLSSSTSAEFFDGSLADLRMYSRALTGNEILSIATSHGMTENVAGLQANFQFKGPKDATIAAGTTFKDLSKNGLVATLVSGARYDTEITKRRRNP